MSWRGLLRALATRRVSWMGDGVDDAARAASQPLLYEFARVLGELASATTKLNNESERRSYLVALGSPEQLKRRTGSAWLPGSRIPTWEALAEGTFRGFAAWLVSAQESLVRNGARTAAATLMAAMLDSHVPVACVPRTDGTHALPRLMGAADAAVGALRNCRNHCWQQQQCHKAPLRHPQRRGWCGQLM